MKRLLLATLPISILLSMSAVSADPRDDIDGIYDKTHQVRNMNVDCTGMDDNCGLEEVHDRVTINRTATGNFWVEIELVGVNLHTCSAKGNGKWEKDKAILVMLKPGEFDSGTCAVALGLDHNGLLHLKSEPYKACSRYCGASTHLESSGLLKKMVPNN